MRNSFLSFKNYQINSETLLHQGEIRKAKRKEKISTANIKQHPKVCDKYRAGGDTALQRP